MPAPDIPSTIQFNIQFDRDCVAGIKQLSAILEHASVRSDPAVELALELRVNRAEGHDGATQ